MVATSFAANAAAFCRITATIAFSSSLVCADAVAEPKTNAPNTAAKAVEKKSFLVINVKSSKFQILKHICFLNRENESDRP